MNLDGVTHSLEDVGDGDLRGMHPHGVTMAEWIGGVCVRVLTINALTKLCQKFLVLLLIFFKDGPSNKRSYIDTNK